MQTTQQQTWITTTTKSSSSLMMPTDFQSGWWFPLISLSLSTHMPASDAHNSDKTLWQWQNKGRCTQSHTLWLGRTWQTDHSWFLPHHPVDHMGRKVHTGFCFKFPKVEVNFSRPRYWLSFTQNLSRSIILYFPFVNQICLRVVLS